jgi:serine protease AprX
MKVLDNSGNGTEEEVALGIDYCITMITINPSLAPSVLNISLGTADLGDPDSPLRVACRAAIAEGMVVIAAAGNGGPGYNTIMSPACDPQVIAVGSCNVTDHAVSYFSSRGPTLEGAIKPDCVLFGENIVVASAASDTAVSAKSGTSFAAPLASCMALLSQEGIIRLVSYSGGVPLGLQPSALSQTLTNSKLLNTYLPKVTVKPVANSTSTTTPSTTKDNDYGYGLPFGTLITQEINPASNLNISGLIGFMLVMMMMKMMMGMMSNMNQPKQVSQPRKQLTGFGI